MNIAIINKTICVNTVVFDADSGLTLAKEFLASGIWPDADEVAELPAGFGIGDKYIDSKWISSPRPEPELPPQANLAEHDPFVKLRRDLTDLRVDLIIAGSLPMPPFDNLHMLYISDQMSRSTLQKLAEKDMISTTALNSWAAEHVKIYGY